jgi:F-type H+-transporting ATPase subunit alpha
VADISRFEREFLDFVGRQHKGIYDAIIADTKIEGDIVDQLQNAIEEFKKTFETTAESK